MIKVIIFDAFGTLIRVEAGASAASVLAKIPDPKPDLQEFSREWKRFYRDSTKDGSSFMSERMIFQERLTRIYLRYDVNRDPERDNFLTMESFKDRVLYPEVQESIAELQKKYRVVIASNTDNDILEAIMLRQGLTVDGVFTSEDIRHYKPSPLFYKAVLDSLEVRADECIFVGDSIIDDIVGPKAAGMKTVLIDRGADSPKPEAADQKLDHIPKDFDL